MGERRTDEVENDQKRQTERYSIRYFTDVLKWVSKVSDAFRVQPTNVSQLACSSRILVQPYH